MEDREWIRLKKFLCCLLCMLLIASAALGESIPRADEGLDVDALARYDSWAEERNGNFTVSGDAASQLERAYRERADRNGLSDALMFEMALEGNAQTGVACPVLKVLYTGRTAANPRALLITLDDTTCVFPLNAEARSGARVETGVCYLNGAALSFLSRLYDAREASMCLLGDGQLIVEAKKRDGFYPSAAAEFAAESFRALSLPDGAPDFSTYGLEDLARQAFAARHGDARLPELRQKGASGSVTTDAVFGLIGTGATQDAVRDTQALLAARGFMKTGTGRVVNDEMRAAVLRAQKRYGLMETGYADAALLNLLSGAESEPVDEAEAYTYTQNADKARFALNRWWAASGVDTTQTGGIKTSADADNVLILADGVIQNQSAEALSLSWDVSATCTYEGQWSFPANVYCEKNGGESFAGTLGILARARLVVACEVPAYLLDEGGAWTLTLNLGTESFAFELLP